MVLLHGRRGPFDKSANGRYTAATLSRRHRAWGALWANQGCLALLVDSFGTRGYPQGFPNGSYEERPPEVSEKKARPLDAYGALAWLHGRPDVRSDRIGLQGWSNGGMAALWTMSSTWLPDSSPGTQSGFRAALVFYPGCRRLRDEAPEYQPYAPVRMYLAGKDQEVNPRTCAKFARAVAEDGGLLEVLEYTDAHHNFDDPGAEEPADREAAKAARADAVAFFAAQLGS